MSFLSHLPVDVVRVLEPPHGLDDQHRRDDVGQDGGDQGPQDLDPRVPEAEPSARLGRGRAHARGHQRRGQARSVAQHVRRVGHHGQRVRQGPARELGADEDDAEHQGGEEAALGLGGSGRRGGARGCGCPGGESAAGLCLAAVGAVFGVVCGGGGVGLCKLGSFRG